MITCNLTGNLANQLFQIFTTICYARQNNDTFYFILSNQLSDGNETFWDSLFQRISLYNTLPWSTSLSKILIKEQNPNKFMPIPRLNNLVKRSNIIVQIIGNYNNYNYFNAEKDAIFHLIDFKGQSDRKFLPKYDIGVWDDISLNPQFVSHCLDKYSKPSVLYYSQTDDSGIDIATRLLQFSQCCKHYIISNTPMAFWSAYLNNSPTKQVYYNTNNKKLSYPPDWKGISDFI